MAIAARIARVRAAAWLGWKVESNWADPVLFAVYVVARPLAVALILAAMYQAVKSPVTDARLFAGFFVANALHAYANTVVVGMGWVVFEEREEYETLKYVYAAPFGVVPYLIGRSIVKLALASITVVLTLALGWFALDIRWNPAEVRGLELGAAMLLGLAGTFSLGFLLAGAALVMTRAAVTTLEGITQGLYLLCGVLFPVDLLPLPLQWIAYALPFTWWYEAVRRFLLGRGSSATLAPWSDAQLLGALAAVTLVFGVLANSGYAACERRARRLGRLDQTTLF